MIDIPFFTSPLNSQSLLALPLQVASRTLSTIISMIISQSSWKNYVVPFIGNVIDAMPVESAYFQIWALKLLPLDSKMALC